MSARHLYTALASVGPTPCEKFSCHMRSHCSDDLLACDAFLFYVNNETAAPPHPQHVFDGNGKLKMTDRVTATREKFDQLSRDEYV